MTVLADLRRTIRDHRPVLITEGEERCRCGWTALGQHLALLGIEYAEHLADVFAERES